MNYRSAFTLLILAILCFKASAQNDESGMQTLLGGGIYANGGYGGFNMAYTELDGLGTIYFGGQGGWVINHTFVIGGGGYGFTSDLRFDQELNADYQFDGGYGGVLFEYILKPNRVIHFSFPLLIGGGGVRYTRDTRNYNSGFQQDEAGFFIIEPGVELQINVLPFMRVAFGGRYKITSDINLNYRISNNRIANSGLLRAPSANISFKFGRF